MRGDRGGLTELVAAAGVVAGRRRFASLVHPMAVTKYPPQPISPPVARAVAARFSPAERRAAGDLLAAYFCRDDRVHLALLALSDGELRSLADLTRVVTDYRDILALEPYTGTGKLRSEPAREWLDREFAGYGIPVPKGLR